MARPEKIRLGEILVQQKLLTADQLNLALAEQKRSGRKLGRVFIEQGYVTEEEISEALAKQLRIAYINLKYYNLRPEVAQKLPETQARFADLGMTSEGSSPEALDATIKSEIAKWAKVIKDADIKPAD